MWSVQSSKKLMKSISVYKFSQGMLLQIKIAVMFCSAVCICYIIFNVILSLYRLEVPLNVEVCRCYLFYWNYNATICSPAIPYFNTRNILFWSVWPYSTFHHISLCHTSVFPYFHLITHACLFYTDITWCMYLVPSVSCTLVRSTCIPHPDF